MKKIWGVLFGCTLLAGCIGYETDLQDAQQERDALLLQKRTKEGCTFVRDQDAYRECLLNTYYSQYPKGYQTAELVDGEPIAIVGNSFSGYAQATAQVAPLPPSTPKVVPYSTTEITTTDSTFTQEYVTPQATVVQAREVVAQMPVFEPLPIPQKMVAQVPVETALPEPAPMVRTVAIPESVQQPVVQQDPTWWENYQQNRTVVQSAVKCPCDDPNDPCPQCYEK